MEGGPAPAGLPTLHANPPRFLEIVRRAFKNTKGAKNPAKVSLRPLICACWNRVY